MTAEDEIRALHTAWFEASERKDLDASMAPIADDVVSYEHEMPLQYRGVDALRETCRAGFEKSATELRWDIPDLQIVVRGDIAVTWGLNRMRNREPGKPAYELWSRGTRIFQRRDGRWQMIHQHVSFPYDQQTGRAVFGIEAAR